MEGSCSPPIASGDCRPSGDLAFFLLPESYRWNPTAVYSKRKSFHSFAGLADLHSSLGHSKAATLCQPRRRRDALLPCCACAGQRYTYEPARAASQKLQRRAKNGQQQRSGRTVRRLELRSRVRSSVGSSFCKARLDWRSTSLCRGLGFRSRVRVCGGVFVSFSHSETCLVLGGITDLIITAVYFSIEYTPTPSHRSASHSRGGTTVKIY